MRAATEGGGTFRTTIEILHPELRSLMGLKEKRGVVADSRSKEALEEGSLEAASCHLDCQVSLTSDPATLRKIFIISLIDVTAAVAAQRELQRAHALLEEEKV